MKHTPFLLCILDGWGISSETKYNAVKLAKTPTWNRIWQKFPSTLLDASAEAVGLPPATIGNSEVGHMNIGAGRIVYQDLTRIQKTITEGSFFKNQTLLHLSKILKREGGRLHLMGLLSDGGVHSHLEHLFALLDFAKQEGLQDIFIHCFMDGRDTPPQAGKKYLQKLEEKIRQVGVGKIATVMGRYYAMDRDKHWERTALAYHAMVCGEGEMVLKPVEAIEKAYKGGTGDEFLLPMVVVNDSSPVGLMQDGDSILFFNFRADRARQITQALNQTDFSFFERKKIPKINQYVTLTQYEKSYPYPNVFSPQNLDNVLGEILSREGLKQFRIAETEKYAHVTYFLNGGREILFAGEERCLIPSPRDVATYDLKPEMSALEVTQAVLNCLEKKSADVVILNFANPDMVGHSGNLKAAIRAVETVDQCLGKILDKLEALGGAAIVTADHGNSECMAHPDGSPHTSHTLNPVPFILVGSSLKEKTLKKRGKLCDIAPTILQLLEIQQPKEMTGHSLL